MLDPNYVFDPRGGERNRVRRNRCEELYKVLQNYSFFDQFCNEMQGIAGEANTSIRDPIHYTSDNYPPELDLLRGALNLTRTAEEYAETFSDMYQYITRERREAAAVAHRLSGAVPAAAPVAPAAAPVTTNTSSDTTCSCNII